MPDNRQESQASVTAKPILPTS